VALALNEVTLAGVLLGDTVALDHTKLPMATVADATPGVNKPVEVMGLGLSGADAAFYRVKGYDPVTVTFTKKKEETLQEETLMVINGEVIESGFNTTYDSLADEINIEMVIDPAQLEVLLQEAPAPTVKIDFDGIGGRVSTEISSQQIELMQEYDATLEFETSFASYELPANELNISSIMTQLDPKEEIEQIAFKMTISELPPDQVGKFTYNLDMMLVEYFKPVDFIIYAFDPFDPNEKVEVPEFNRFVGRSILIPEGVDPKLVKTGVILNKDGTFSPIPTFIYDKNGETYAKFYSTTNSVYTVIFGTEQKKFTDTQSHWAKASIDNMAKRMIVNGKAAQTFDPGSAVTRAEFAAMLVRALGLTKYQSETTFTDVVKGKWYYHVIQIAAGQGLLKGYPDGTFRPSGQITREEAAVIMGRALKWTKLQGTLSTTEINSVLSAFKDQAKTASFARTALAQMAKHSILGGYLGMMNPKAKITRAETTVIIERLLKKAGLI
jgi:hypothetical protein